MTAETDRPPLSGGERSTPTPGAEPSVSLGDWLDRLADQLPAGSTTAITPGEQAALLDLARVAAHTSERISAPISTFLVGVAYASVPGDERAQRIRELARALEAR